MRLGGVQSLRPSVRGSPAERMLHSPYKHHLLRPQAVGMRPHCLLIALGDEGSSTLRLPPCDARELALVEVGACAHTERLR